jgi:hypothetical protein
MSIKSQGGVFGRNPTFNDVTVDGERLLMKSDKSSVDFGSVETQEAVR